MIEAMKVKVLLIYRGVFFYRGVCEYISLRFLYIFRLFYRRESFWFESFLFY